MDDDYFTSKKEYLFSSEIKNFDRNECEDILSIKGDTMKVIINIRGKIMTR